MWYCILREYLFKNISLEINDDFRLILTLLGQQGTTNFLTEVFPF